MDLRQYLEILSFQQGMNMDANEVAIFARQLEHVKSQTYDVQYGLNKAKQFIPIDNSAGPDADSITYRQWDQFEMAKFIANYADDLPRVTVSAKEFTLPVRSIGTSYDWSIQDIRRSQRAGAQLDERLARAARMATERKIDEIGAIGDANVGLPGFLNNANVPVAVLPNAGAWSGLSVDEMLENLNFLSQAVITATLEVFQPDTIILGNTEFGAISMKAIGVDNRDTILKSFLANSPYIRNIDQWSRLNTAGAGGVARMICYRRDPTVVQFNIPLEFEQLPPQAKNLGFMVPCHARVGGVEWHYPLAAVYADVI